MSGRLYLLMMVWAVLQALWPANPSFILDVDYRLWITWIILQQLGGYKVEDKLHLGAREQIKFEYHWSRKCGSLEVSHSYRPQQPITGTAFVFVFQSVTFGIQFRGTHCNAIWFAVCAAAMIGWRGLNAPLFSVIVLSITIICSACLPQRCLDVARRLSQTR
jgi:hypothetical protein